MSESTVKALVESAHRLGGSLKNLSFHVLEDTHEETGATVLVECRAIAYWHNTPVAVRYFTNNDAGCCPKCGGELYRHECPVEFAHDGEVDDRWHTDFFSLEDWQAVLHKDVYDKFYSLLANNGFAWRESAANGKLKPLNLIVPTW